MNSPAHQMGREAAARVFGAKTAGILVPGAGALLGYALAPRGEEERGAILGGLGGLGLQSMFMGPGKLAPAIAGAAPVSAVPGPATPALPWKEALRQVGASRLGTWLKSPVKTGAFSESLSLPVPGLGGLGLKSTDVDDRLRGMRRWVPRPMLERAFDADDDATPVEEFVDSELTRDTLRRPAMSAALGGGLGASFASRFKKTPIQGGLLGAGVGAAGGLLSHFLSKDDVRRRAEEAMAGAAADRRPFLNHRESGAASEPLPLTLRSGSPG